MNQVKVGAFYANFEVTDEAMGIAGPEFDGGREGTLRSQICRKIIAQLGSDSFCIGMYKYKPGGQATDYVVIFKIERTAGHSHPMVQDCRTNAEALAPHYWSKRETKVGSSLLSFTAHCTNGLFVQFTSLVNYL